MILERAKLKNEIKDYVFITLGTAMYAFAWAVFLLPYEIVSGGVTGMSAIIFYAAGIPIEYSYFVINAIFVTIISFTIALINLGPVPELIGIWWSTYPVLHLVGYLTSVLIEKPVMKLAMTLIDDLPIKERS